MLGADTFALVSMSGWLKFPETLLILATPLKSSAEMWAWKPREETILCLYILHMTHGHESHASIETNRSNFDSKVDWIGCGMLSGPHNYLRSREQRKKAAVKKLKLSAEERPGKSFSRGNWTDRRTNYHSDNTRPITWLLGPVLRAMCKVPYGDYMERFIRWWNRYKRQTGKLFPSRRRTYPRPLISAHGILTRMARL